MSKVKKWYIGVYGGEAQARPCSPAQFEIIRDCDRRYFVVEDEYDRVVAERDALQQRLNTADERADRLEADKRAMTETHVLYTWLRKKCDQPFNDVVAVNMNIGHDWVPVHDLDRDLRAMIDQEEP